MEAINLKKLRRSLFDIPPSEKVCRSLFGEVDHEATKKDMQREMLEDMQQRSQLWNFDFENYIPMGKENGLNWVGCPSDVAEFKIRPGISLVTSFTARDSFSKNSLTEITVASSPNRDSIPLELQSRLEPHTPEKDKEASTDDNECNVIKIINSSPIRPRILRSEANTAEKFRIIQSMGGKRKRGTQQRIDGKNIIYTDMYYIAI